VKEKRSGKSAGFDFWGASYVLLQPYLGNFEKYFEELRVDLSKAGLRITYRAYVAGTVLASTIGVAAGGTAGLLTASLLHKPWILDVLMLFGFAVLGGALTFSVFYVFPSIRAKSRGKRLDSELSYTLGHMAVLASSGMTLGGMFHSLAEEDSKDVVNQEAKMIVRDLSLLGMDLRHALEAEKKRSPSAAFTEFLDGLISASRTGGDLKSYLLRTASSMMLEKRLKAKSLGESVGMVAEMYTIILVVTPLLLLIMFAVMGIVIGSIGGFSILTLIYIITYAVVPLGGLMILVIADSTVSKELA
jgi:archaeal flagellar protein FlaJ